MANGTLQLGTEGVPEKLYLASETSLLGGVILLKLFDLSNGFKVIDFKIAIFWPNQPWISPKLWPRSKSFRSMTPPKVRFLRPNKVLGAQKSFLGPPKTQKIDFLKKLELYDLAAHSWGLPQYPVTRSHWSFQWRIHLIKNLLPAWCAQETSVK